MKILFLGDVVGQAGCGAIKKNLQKIIKEENIDFTIVNGENAADEGIGITQNILDEFVACGVDGEIAYSSNGSSWTSGPVVAENLYGITYGDNKFIAVGLNGKIIQSDNGTSWSSVDNTSNTRTLNSIAYGNNKYVAVGSRTIISSSDNGSSFGVTSTTLSFNNISYGNDLVSIF